MLCLVAQSCRTLYDPVGCSLPDSSVHEDSPGKNTGVGCHALLQGIFPTHESNPGLWHCRRILYHLSHQGCPRIEDPFLKIFKSMLILKLVGKYCKNDETFCIAVFHSPFRISTSPIILKSTLLPFTAEEVETWLLVETWLKSQSY